MTREQAITQGNEKIRKRRALPDNALFFLSPVTAALPPISFLIDNPDDVVTVELKGYTGYRGTNGNTVEPSRTNP